MALNTTRFGIRDNYLQNSVDISIIAVYYVGYDLYKETKTIPLRTYCYC